MIRLGLRLAVSGGREAVTRLVIVAIAVGIGVGLLLTAVAAVNAVNTQNDRYAWLDTGASSPSQVRLDILHGDQHGTFRGPFRSTLIEHVGMSVYQARQHRCGC